MFRADAVPVDTPERWAALRAPLRQRMLMLLEDGRPWTARELAASTGRTPQALYRHLSILVASGLVLEEGEPSTRPNEGRRYRLAGPLRLIGADGPFAAEYAGCVDRLFRDAARIHRQRPVDASGLISFNLVHLTADEARDVLRRLHAILDDVRTLARAPGAAEERGRLTHAPVQYSVTLAFAEVTAASPEDPSED